jgi:hypothetical protein
MKRVSWRKNNRLKRIVADLSLDKAMLQNVLSKNAEACRADAGANLQDRWPFRTIRVSRDPTSSPANSISGLEGVVLDFSPPGKPTDISVIEAFIGKFRSECLKHPLVPEP